MLPDPQSDRRSDAAKAQEEKRDYYLNVKINSMPVPPPEPGELVEEPLITSPDPASEEEIYAPPIRQAPAPLTRGLQLSSFSDAEVLAYISQKLGAEQVFAHVVEAHQMHDVMKLHTSDLILNWQVMMCSVQEETIVFFTDRKQNCPELGPSKRYVLEHKGIKYPVMFVGGFYPSTNFRFALMCFFRKDEEPHD